MRRIRSMLIPVRGQIRRRAARASCPEMGAWLPWVRPPGVELVQFRARIEERNRSDLRSEVDRVLLERAGAETPPMHSESARRRISKHPMTGFVTRLKSLARNSARRLLRANRGASDRQ